VLQCSVLQCVAVCCSVSQCVAVCRSVLQCVAVCCSMRIRDATHVNESLSLSLSLTRVTNINENGHTYDGVMSHI